MQAGKAHDHYSAWPAVSASCTTPPNAAVRILRLIVAFGWARLFDRLGQAKEGRSLPHWKL